MQTNQKGHLCIFLLLILCTANGWCSATLENDNNQTPNSSSLTQEKQIIDDCCCSKSDLLVANRKLNTLLNAIVKQPFFSYFKVDLYSECPFWVSESLCTTEGPGSCGICECDENDPVLRHWKETKTDLVSVLDNQQLKQWNDAGSEMWFLPAPEAEMSFVNLNNYTEAFTGFDGTPIWKRIYEENCFTHVQGDMCLEEKIFFKLISGLHTSINTHICFNNNQGPRGAWIDDPARLNEKILSYPDRIENLHFSFLFLSRAISKVKPILSTLTYDTGNPSEDLFTKHTMDKLLSSDLVCSPNFDEGALFQDPSKQGLRDQFKMTFRNISSIMNCLSCEKCRVFGKLQTLALGTALKIVLEPNFDHVLQTLQRNEVIALIYTYRQLSNSIKYIDTMSITPAAPPSARIWSLIDSFLLIVNFLVLLLLYKTFFSSPSKRKQD